MTKKEIKARIAILEDTLTGNLLLDLDLRDQIHKLKMELNGTKPTDSSIECIGCGS